MLFGHALNQYTASKSFVKGFLIGHFMHIFRIVKFVEKYQDVKILISCYVLLDKIKRPNYERAPG